MFPIFFKFKGGKGVATSAMVILMISPITCLFCLLIFIIIVVGTRYVSLGSVMGLIFYPILLTAFSGGQNPTACAMSVLMALAVVFMHRENLKRLREGTERKITFKKKKPAEGASEEEPKTDK
jgi:glycerol-3-phosphate acyltransferase PlsY